MGQGHLYIYILITLLNIGKIVGQCTFPASWVEKGGSFVDFAIQGPNNILMVQLRNDALRLVLQLGAADSNLGTDCHGATGDEDQLSVAWSDALTGTNSCDHVIEGDQENAILFQRNTKDSATSLSDCQFPYESYVAGILAKPASVEFPGSTTQQILDGFRSLSPTEIPLNVGNYQAEMSDSTGRHCQDDMSSMVQITSTTLKLTLCKETGPSQKTLNWIDNWSPQGSETNGSIALLMDLSGSASDDPPYKLYCARYKVEGLSVQMSVEYADLNLASCDGSMTYETVDATTFTFNFTYPPDAEGSETGSAGASYSPTILITLLTGMLSFFY